MRNTIVVILLVVLFLAISSSAAVRGKDAMYVGGTFTDIPEKTKGKFDLADEMVAVFTTKKNQTIRIPYKAISSLEYGQKAGRRVGAAVVVSPLLLFSKKRKHYLTINFADESGKEQAAVFELSKGTVDDTADTLESRSGRKIEFESEEARKHFEKSK
ncbi:MAG: hypothetical protein HY656_04000 [Acidobacteria bacterium]|nr:hypothetical protein [Acidobacteriota bacterium]